MFFHLQRQYPIRWSQGLLETNYAVPVMDNLIAQLEGRLGDRQHTDLFIVLPSIILKCDIGVYEKK